MTSLNNSLYIPAVCLAYGRTMLAPPGLCSSSVGPSPIPHNSTSLKPARPLSTVAVTQLVPLAKGASFHFPAKSAARKDLRTLLHWRGCGSDKAMATSRSPPCVKISSPRRKISASNAGHSRQALFPAALFGCRGSQLGKSMRAVDSQPCNRHLTMGIVNSKVMGWQVGTLINVVLLTMHVLQRNVTSSCKLLS